MNHPVWNYLHENRVPIIVGMTTIVTAIVKTAPIPPDNSVWYAWGYDFGHQVFNITNARLAKKDIPTPPESPAKVQDDPPHL